MTPAPGDERVAALLAELSFEEKLSLVRGGPDPEGVATGYITGVERLGLPPLRMIDGPMGIRDGEATAFPATIALGATWDRDLARRMGQAIAREARGRGQDVLLAPGINVVRVPTSGRNFEFVSEDPLLTGDLGVAYVEGVESQAVAATPKHYVANNQETNRSQIDVDVGERALREIYLEPFRRVVTGADPGAVMAAYNRVHGEHMTANRRLLTEVLDEEWDFDGLTVSDWWSTHDAAAALSAGLDVEMPGVDVVEWVAPNSRVASLIHAVAPSRRLGIEPPIVRRLFDRFIAKPGQPVPFGTGLFGDPLRAAIEDGAVGRERLDDAVGAVLRTYEDVGLLEGARGSIDVDVAAHADLAREIARRGSVVLENDGTLPLEDGSIAVIGPNADRAKVGGGGSSDVTPTESISILKGLRARRSGPITHEAGLPRVAEPWPFGLPGRGRVLPRLGRSPSIADAVDAAADADVAVVVVQDAATEGEDRPSMALPGDQDRLVDAVAAANDRTVVVSQTSGPVAMPWVEDVAAVVQCWYPGQAGGAAVTDVLYGTDPGGRLPVTFGEAFADYPVADERRYPGVDGTVHYDEGVFVGYRHFDSADVDPLFPFGHGRSYAEFAYEAIDVERTDGGATVSATVANGADRRGREVVQVYARPPAGPIERPERELVGFEPVTLTAGESTTVEIPIEERDLARYDADASEWTVDPGEYGIDVGRSSRDRRLHASLEW